jgi:hypothetical protein
LNFKLHRVKKVDFKQKIQLLEVEEKVVERQLEAMRKMEGNSFWPKPILHPSVEENFDRLVYIQIKPCGFVLGVFIAMI